MKLFDRYADAPEQNDVLMPEDDLHANVAIMTIGELLGKYERFTREQEELRAMYPWASRFVLGHPLPVWQRDPTWTLEQKSRFITSIWAGVDIGSYLINDLFRIVRTPDGHEVMLENSDIVLDGQQRLLAIQSYIESEFPVVDTEGRPRFWSELSRDERRRFSLYRFTRATIKSFDEKKLRTAYDLRAFGGTPHREDQRASNP